MRAEAESEAVVRSEMVVHSFWKLFVGRDRVRVGRGVARVRRVKERMRMVLVVEIGFGKCMSDDMFNGIFCGFAFKNFMRLWMRTEGVLKCNVFWRHEWIIGD